ncbi:MAG: hypothetical protein IKW00_08795 [Clostridia bacterium]|nr:hypothetical protein [Clostridia bacterium]
MFKRILAFALLLLLSFSLLPAAQADTLMLPNPAVFSGGALSLQQSTKSQYALCLSYTVQGDTAAQYALSYVEMLKQQPTLKYAGSSVQDHGSYFGTHHYFVPNGAAYSCFSMADTEGNICADVFYDYGGNYSAHNVIVYFSTDFLLGAAPAAPAAAAASPSSETAPVLIVENKLPQIQDPRPFFSPDLTHWSNAQESKKGFWLSYTAKSYSVGDALVSVYSEYLTKLGFTLTDSIEGEWGDIFYCYNAPSGYNLSTYSYSFTDAKGKTRNVAPHVLISHKPGAMYMSFHFGKGFELTDLGLRLDADRQEELEKIGGEERREYIREVMKSIEETRGQSGSGGNDDFFSGNDKKSSGGTRTKNCSAVGCDRGKVKCRSCDGQGGKYVYSSSPNYSGSKSGSRVGSTWESCRKCYGSGKVDCSTCGGDGKVEY